MKVAEVAWLAMLGAVALGACGGSKSEDVEGDLSGKKPDSLPVMLNTELPFRYPPALYTEKVEGNVTLRLFIDESGTVVADSTQVVESSASNLLDSAAVRGANDFKFVPAKLKGVPMAVAILFPIYFRHPEVTPTDSVKNPGTPPNTGQ